MSDASDNQTSEPRPRALSRFRQRLPLQTLAIEVFSIVLAVLLALGVNEWREERAQRRRAAAALDQVRMELEYNRSALQVLHPRNQYVVNVLAQSETSDTASVQFIPGLQLRRTAWESAQRSDILAHLDYDRVLDLARLYATQRIYTTMGNQFIQAAMNAAAFSQDSGWEISSTVKRFEVFISLIVMVETQLISHYDELLPQLGSTWSPPDTSASSD